MQKALLMASVIIGAFLFQPNANSQVLTDDGKLGEENFDMCPLGGHYAPALGFCFVPATYTDSYITVGPTGKTHKSSDVGSLIDSLMSDFPYQTIDNLGCATSYTASFQSVSPGVIYLSVTSRTPGPYPCPDIRQTNLRNFNYELSPEQVPQCPPESSNPNFQVFNQGPYETEEGYNICYYPSSDPGNDHDCPEGTVGGCEPPEPDCIIAGNGMEVCKEDPNEKCDSTEQNGQTVYFNCEAGCGFVNDQFLCTTEPDSDGEIPDLSDCFKVGSSWACPSDPPTPDDNIDDPQKPINDMTKGDFKQVQRGVETRLDATNSLLADSNAIGKSIGEGISDLNAKQLAANGILRDIRQNTLDTKNALYGDALEIEPDTAESILSGLGLTGDEKFSDLEKEVISLDSYRSQFTWSAGSSSCPPDRSMSLLGSSFLIDWQPYCDAFGVLGYFVKAAAFLISGFIAFGVRK